MTRRHLGIYSGKRAPGNYVMAEVPVCDGRWTLYVDGNSKITGANTGFACQDCKTWHPIAAWGDAAEHGGCFVCPTCNASTEAANLDPFDHPAPNAFSLPHIATCPGSTEQCRASCYVHGLEEHAKELHRHYTLNLMSLNGILEYEAYVAQSAEDLGDWITANAPHGFRWHVSGDLFSSAYAEWLRYTVSRAPTVQHWIYTRSHELAPVLSRLPNLTVNLSVDRNNYRDVRAYFSNDFGESFDAFTERYRLCYLAADDEQPPDDLPDGSVVFPDYGNRGRSLDDPREHPWWQQLSERARQMVCPADFFGQSREYRCGVCTKCIRPVGAT